MRITLSRGTSEVGNSVNFACEILYSLYQNFLDCLFASIQNLSARASRHKAQNSFSRYKHRKKEKAESDATSWASGECNKHSSKNAHKKANEFSTELTY